MRGRAGLVSEISVYSGLKILPYEQFIPGYRDERRDEFWAVRVASSCAAIFSTS